MSLVQDGKGLLHDISLGDHHVEGRHRKVEQRGVIDLLANWQVSAEQDSAPRPDGEDIAGQQRGLRRGFNQLGASPDALHEDAIGARRPLDIRHGPACRDVGQPVCTDAPFLVRQANLLSEASAARRHLSRQFPALRLHVDAKQPWSRD